MSLYKHQRNQVKDQIYRTAIILFSEKGYEHIPVEVITKTVGIAKGTFYNFFSSKRDILMMWAKEEFQKLDFNSSLTPDKIIEDNLYSLIRFLVKAIGVNLNLFKSFLNELVRINSDKEATNGDFDFVQIFSAVVRCSCDFDSIGKAYYEEKINLLDHSMFIAVINWFNKGNELDGLEQHLTNIVRVCLYGILTNLED